MTRQQRCLFTGWVDEAELFTLQTSVYSGSVLFICNVSRWTGMNIESYNRNRVDSYIYAQLYLCVCWFVCLLCLCVCHSYSLYVLLSVFLCISDVQTVGEVGIIVSRYRLQIYLQEPITGNLNN